MHFKDVVSDPAQFRALMGEPPPPCVAKTIAALDQHCRAFIARSPFVLIASSNALGKMDISPKGDAPGFVRVLDDHTLVIPDRTGNNRLDSMGNLVVNNEIGLFFMIPGVHESLRIKGTAIMSRDPELIAASVVDGKPPKTMLVVSVYWAFIHCGKALNRSRVWQDDYFVDANKWKLARGTLENSYESAVKLR